jgi:hypothetical protein
LPETIDLDFRKFLDAFNSLGAPPKPAAASRAQTPKQTTERKQDHE